MNIVVFYSHAAQEGIVEALKNLGHNVFCFQYGVKKSNIIKRIKIKISKNKSDEFEKAFNNQIQLFEKRHLTIRAELIIFMKGHYLNRKSQLFLEKLEVPMVQWTTDSLVRFPGQASITPYMKKVFFQDGSDITNSINGEWLPLGFDQHIFKFNPNKVIDVLMVGTVSLPYYKKRRDYFYQISRLAKKDIRVSFAGRGEDKELTRRFRQDGVTILGQLPFKQYAETISKSKIVVNIHQDDGGMAINPLFFAIPATGSLQVTDKLNHLNVWLDYPSLINSANIENVNDLIVGILKQYNLNENWSLSKEISEKHSYEGRVMHIIESCKPLLFSNTNNA